MKFAFLLALTGVLHLCSSAQETEKSEKLGFIAGVKVGMNTSQMTGDGYSGFYKFNPQGGIFLQRPLKKGHQMQFELLYIRKGSRFPGNPDKNIFTTYKIEQDYIEIPLLYQFKWRKFLFEGGPGLGVLFRTKEEDSFGTVPASGFKWRPWEADLMVGVNYNLNENLFANLRLHQSILSTVSTVAVTPYGTFGGTYNIVIGTSLNWKF